MRTTFKKLLNSSQHSNSIYIMVAQGAVTIFGYIFWLLASKLYSNSDVGIASSLVSVSLLVSQVSILGLNQALVRFLPKAKNKNLVINSCLNAVTIASLLLSTIYSLFFASQILHSTNGLLYGILFIISTILTTVNMFTDSIFLSNRATVYNVKIYGIYGVARVIMPVLFIGYGSIGIFASNLIGTAPAVFFSFYYMYKKLSYRYSKAIDIKALKKMASYTIGNYLAAFFWIAPMLAAPSIALAITGSKSAAYLYITITIFNILLIIPTSATQSLFAEGSHRSKDELWSIVRKSAVFTFCIQIIAIIGLMCLGKIIISTFGKSYADSGVYLLYILAPTSLIVTLNMIGNTILKIKDSIKQLVYINAAGSFATILFIVLLIKNFGIIGVGIGYMAGQTMMIALHLLQLALSRYKDGKAHSINRMEVVLEPPR